MGLAIFDLYRVQYTRIAEVPPDENPREASVRQSAYRIRLRKPTRFCQDADLRYNAVRRHNGF